MKHGTRTPASPRYHPPYISQDGTTHSVIVGYGPIDVWYDCEGCMHEAVEWASDHGFSQCVSPDIKREGTDKGLWATAHHKRWTLWDRHEVAHGGPRAVIRLWSLAAVRLWPVIRLWA